MKTYARVVSGMVVEIAGPMIYDAESPYWKEGDPSRIGQDNPIELWRTAEDVAMFHEITGLDPAPVYGWTFDGTTFSPPFTGVTLAQASANKVTELRQKCDDAIERGSFTSSALGTVHNYDCRLIDQLNINTRYAVAAHTGAVGPLWASDGTRYTWKDHTSDQLIGVMVDMDSHIKENQVLLAAKLAAVEAATTVDQVNAVTW